MSAKKKQKVLFVCYSRCSTCKKARAWLDANGVDYEYREIVEKKPNQTELRAWKKLAGVPIRRMFNTSGNLYRELEVKKQLDEGMKDADAIRLLATDGMLVKRPVLVGEDFAFFGFREAEWAEALGV